MELTQQEIERLVTAALAEDVGSGDATTLALVPEDADCRAELLLEEPGVVCGVPVAASVFRALDPEMRVAARPDEGPAGLRGPGGDRGARAGDPERRAAPPKPARAALRLLSPPPPFRRADRRHP